jgi:hypothetical protein
VVRKFYESVLRYRQIGDFEALLRKPSTGVKDTFVFLREAAVNLEKMSAHAKDIVFTSGATESNNMIVKGIAKFYGSKRNHIITTQTVSLLNRATCCG